MNSIAGQAHLTALNPGMTSPVAAAKARTRLIAIDALRGLVMLFMLVDHVREHGSCICRSQIPLTRI
ncbi:hypothetical protein [Sphingobium sp. Leaf26]|uniref:hypothetical protein n=1 Tax=Sphingobium sp. Leaf26 TaxID=1735693 RepID=UPI000AA5F1B4